MPLKVTYAVRCDCRLPILQLQVVKRKGVSSVVTRTDSKPAIEINELTKSYGRTAVLRGLDLKLDWGEVVTILGSNGSGKTTLINIISSLTKPDSGTVEVGGVNVRARGTVARRFMGVVTHGPLLYEQLTGYENLRFHAAMFGIGKFDERIDTVARQLGVEARLNQRVGTLSHGMQKRISIARALLHNPPLLLMDEPESGLDQEALKMLEEVVRELVESGRTVLMTSHNLDRVLAMSCRIAILREGRVVYEEDLKSSPSADGVKEAYAWHAGESM